MSHIAVIITHMDRESIHRQHDTALMMYVASARRLQRPVFTATHRRVDGRPFLFSDVSRNDVIDERAQDAYGHRGGARHAA